MECSLDCREGYATFIKPPNPEAPEDQIWSQPVAYCKKGGGERARGRGAGERAVITLHDFGYAPGKRYADIESAQAYFWYTERTGEEGEYVRRGGSGGVRHFNLRAVAGRSEYGKRSTTTYALQDHGSEGGIDLLAKISLGDKRHEAYFAGDPGNARVYCQGASERFEDRRVCISGNVRQLNRVEARERGFRPSGTFSPMRRVDSVPKEGHWVSLDGLRLRLTADRDLALESPRHIQSGIRRSSLEEMREETGATVYIRGDGDLCEISNIIGPKVRASCPGEGK